MISTKLSKTWNFVRTTAIGGILFLLPLAGIVYLLSFVFALVLGVYKNFSVYLPFHSTVSLAILFIITVTSIVLLCFFTGLLASRSLAQQGSLWIEKNLLKVFPKYAIYKDILTGTLGGEENLPSLKPIKVKLNGMERIAFESNRSEDGKIVTVYFPGSPDPWSGFLGIVPEENVYPYAISFSEAVTELEQLGRKRDH